MIYYDYFSVDFYYDIEKKFRTVSKVFALDADLVSFNNLISRFNFRIYRINLS